MVSSAQTAYCLWPLLVTFLRDPVCAVRAAAAAQAGPLLVCLPEAEQPAEQTDAQKAAAAAAALKAAQEEQQQAGSSASSSSSASAVDAAATGAAAGASASDAAEHAVAAVVATHAVSAPSSSHVTPAGSAQPEQGQQLLLHQQPGQQQQQQQQEAGGPGQRLRWMRRGLSSGLYQLQQQVWRVLGNKDGAGSADCGAGSADCIGVQRCTTTDRGARAYIAGAKKHICANQHPVTGPSSTS